MYRQTPAQIREHYEIEKIIAERLRNSTAEERKTLYTWAYDELFRRVPHHELLQGHSDAERRSRVKKEVGILAPLINNDSVFVEIGPGDCAVSLEISKTVRKVYAVDVSKEVTKLESAPDNFELMISDGVNIPLADESVDVAYSNQLMEHLHEDDSLMQLRSIYRVLKPNGVYYCITPNRLSGPHDISRSFDPVATCLHLREFTVTELNRMFKETGFRKTRAYPWFFRFNIKLPVFPFKMIEAVIEPLPDGLRRLLTFNRIAKFILGVKLLGTK